MLLLSLRWWLPLSGAAVLLLVIHVLVATKRLLLAERGQQGASEDSAGSNRRLGLALQGQGDPDLAFDKFRKCPLDDAMMDLMYKLALDFERKQQFSKAAAVFEHMAAHQRNYRDLAQRLARLRQKTGRRAGWQQFRPVAGQACEGRTVYAGVLSDRKRIG